MNARGTWGGGERENLLQLFQLSRQVRSRGLFRTRSVPEKRTDLDSGLFIYVFTREVVFFLSLVRIKN